MELGLDEPLPRPSSLQEGLRPAAIWLGLASFLTGAILLGATLAAPAGSSEPFTGPVLLLLGVSLVGGGFTMDATGFALDPEIDFEGRKRHFVAGVSVLFLLLAAAVMVLSVVS